MCWLKGRHRITHTRRSVYTAKRKTIRNNPGLNERNTRRHDDKHQCLVTQRILIEKCHQKLHPVHIAGTLCPCHPYVVVFFILTTSDESIRTFANVFKIYIWFYSWSLTNKSSNRKLQYSNAKDLFEGTAYVYITWFVCSMSLSALLLLTDLSKIINLI